MFSAPGGKYKIQVLWIKGNGGKTDLAAKVISGYKRDYMLSHGGNLLTHSEFNTKFWLGKNFPAFGQRQSPNYGALSMTHLLGPPEKEAFVQVPIAISHHCYTFGQHLSGKSWKWVAELVCTRRHNTSHPYTFLQETGPSPLRTFTHLSPPCFQSISAVTFQHC